MYLSLLPSNLYNFVHTTFPNSRCTNNCNLHFWKRWFFPSHLANATNGTTWTHDGSQKYLLCLFSPSLFLFCFCFYHKLAITKAGVPISLFAAPKFLFQLCQVVTRCLYTKNGNIVKGIMAHTIVLPGQLIFLTKELHELIHNPLVFPEFGCKYIWLGQAQGVITNPEMVNRKVLGNHFLACKRQGKQGSRCLDRFHDITIS